MADIPEDIKSLAEKIERIKTKKAASEPEDKHSDLSRLSIGMKLGVELAAGTFVGVAIGYTLDEIFDFKFIMLLIFTLLGSFAGMLNAYRYAKNMEENDREKRG